MNDEHDLTPEPQDEADIPAEDLRFAPPGAAEDSESPELLEGDESPVESTLDETTDDDMPEPAPADDPLDIAAALAAVSNLTDYVAEQEAAEQQRVAQAEAEVRAAEEAQARLDYPERFFPVPPQVTIQRGQMASVIPALVLIALGGWLTFTLTTSQSAPDSGLLLALGVGGAALVLLAYWLTASGGWARGMLFFGLSVLLVGGVGFFLLQSASPGLMTGWPLLVAAWGLAYLLTSLLGRPAERSLLLPGLLLVVGSAIGYLVMAGILSGGLVSAIGTLWPVILGIVAVLLLLPLVARRRG
ncbi:MAG: hypothetical protein H6672_05365 [Anaerolineaceae bacterium]|nr:hypothetical protein [Anaerolineaceae bacterium]